MWPFGSSSDPECGSHHYGEWKPPMDNRQFRVDRFTVNEDGDWLHIVEERVKRRCQHKGCLEFETRWAALEHGATQEETAEAIAEALGEDA